MSEPKSDAARRALGGDDPAERLRATEARFHELVDAVTDYAIYVLDDDGRVSTWNVGAQRIKGYAAEEIIGRHFGIFYTPEDRAAGKPDRVLETVRREGRFEEESWRVRKDGSRFWANVVITALRDRAGEIVGFAKVTRDLTERRRAEEERIRVATASAEKEASFESLRALIDNLPDLAWMALPDGHVDFFNQRWAEYTGTTNLAALEGWGWEREVEPDCLAEVSRRWRHSLSTGEPFEMEFPLRGADGRFQWFLTRGRPVRGVDGAIVRWIGTNTNIDARRRAAALERHARAIAEEASRMKDEFLATVSHELRTPLNAILGWASLVRERPLDASLVKPLEVIHRNAQAQAKIIEDILDVSRIITGKLKIEPKPADLRAIAREAIEVVRPSAIAKRITVVFEPDAEPCLLVADPERLQQVIWNLLSNAVKFTDPGGRVTVSLARQDSSFVLEVRDTGRGIDPEFLPYVFDRFRQADGATTRRFGGLGLGLALVRHIVELHGGRVFAESAGVGQGATLRVALPIRAVSPVENDEAPAAPIPSTRSVRGQLAGLRVLVVDDEDDARDLLETVLTDAGAEVFTARSAAEGFDRLLALRPDVLVSDVGMPGEDGYAFMRRVRALTAVDGGQLPSLALTAFAREEDRARAIAAGYTAHVGKPVQPAVLTGMIEGLRSLAPR